MDERGFLEECLIAVSRKMGLMVFRTAWQTEGMSSLREELHIPTVAYTDAELGRMFRQLLEEVGAHDGQ